MNQVELPAVKVLQRWLGLESYTEANAGVFHGRSRESEDLLRFVKRDVLTVVFGPSGTGKTSLLRAGLFPLLRQEGFLPVHIRLDHGVHAASYSAQVRSHLQQACSQQGVEEAELSRPLTGSQDETLWEYLHRTEFWDRRNRAVTPLLAFDQFEELFTVGAAHGGQERFLTEMADVIENYLPAGIRTRLESKEKLPFPYAEAKYKIVVILREEWVPRLDGLRKSIPSIMHNRFPLARMNGAQALEAVMGPGAGVVDGPTAEAVVRFVAASGASAVPAEPEESRLEKLGVEPSLLSLMCAELDRQRSEENLPAITTTKLQEVGANILDDFYERGFRGLKHQARVFVEDRLLTAKGFRGTVPKEDALRAGLLETEIGFLVDRRLIREEERLGIPHLEIIHDVLAKVAFRSRDARRERERLAASAQQLREQEHASRERRERRFKGALAFAALLVLLSAAAAAFSLYFLAEAKTARSEALKQRTKAGDAQKLAEDSLSKSNQLLAQNEQLLGAEKKSAQTSGRGTAKGTAIGGVGSGQEERSGSAGPRARGHTRNEKAGRRRTRNSNPRLGGSS